MVIRLMELSGSRRVSFGGLWLLRTWSASLQLLTCCQQNYPEPSFPTCLPCLHWQTSLIPDTVFGPAIFFFFCCSVARRLPIFFVSQFFLFFGFQILLISALTHASKIMLKILQARLQQYVKWELPDVQPGFRKGRRTRDQITNIL